MKSKPQKKLPLQEVIHKNKSRQHWVIWGEKAVWWIRIIRKIAGHQIRMIRKTGGQRSKPRQHRSMPSTGLLLGLMKSVLWSVLGVILQSKTGPFLPLNDSLYLPTGEDDTKKSDLERNISSTPQSIHETIQTSRTCLSKHACLPMNC